MAEINLLPNELRQKDQKDRERAARRAKVFKVELSRPNTQDKNILKSDTVKKSFWSDVFGVKKEKPAKVINQNENVDSSLSDIKLEKGKFGGDFLPIKNSKVVVNEEYSEVKNPMQAKTKNTWSQLLGPAHLPLTTKPKTGQIVFEKEAPRSQNFSRPIVKPVMQTPVPMVKKPIAPVALKVKKEKSDSWWKIFLDLFSFNKSKINLPKAPLPENLVLPRVAAQAPKLVPLQPVLSKVDPASLLKTKPIKLPKIKGESWWHKLWNQPKIKKQPVILPVAKIENNNIQLPKAENKPAHSVKVKEAKTDNSFHLVDKHEGFMPKINLIPEELLFRKQTNTTTQSIVIVLVVLTAALIVYGGNYLIGIEQNKIDVQIQEKQVTINGLINTIKDNQKVKQRNVFLQQKLLALKNNWDNRVSWSKFFDLLERYTLPTVYYTSFSADNSGLISLPAVADNYEEAARQIVDMRQAKDFVKEVIVDDATLSGNERAGYGVSFILKIKLADNVFKK